MARTDNYSIQARQAMARFTAYDQEKLTAKLKLHGDETYLYTAMLSERYRIHRKTGMIFRETATGWVTADSFSEVMTLLDLICDSREDRYLTGRWKSLTDFGRTFHRNLTETGNDPWAERFEADPAGFRRACESLGGIPFPLGDIAYTMEFFDGLPILLQLWFGDEEFPPCLRFLWDENATMYLKYETMHYARGLLLERIEERM